MNESVKDFNVPENVIAIPGSNIYVIRGVVNQAFESASEIENIDDDILKITSAVLGKVDITDQDITMTENLVATLGSSTKGIREIVDQIAEVKIENREATFKPNTEGIPEIVDQETEGIDAIRNLVATPGPNVEGVSETMDQTVEVLKITENLKVAPASGTEVFTEMMDLDEVSDTESFVTASGSSPERINETMYETTEDISVTEKVFSTLGSNKCTIKGVMNQAVEGTSVIENIDDDIMEITSVPSTEAFLVDIIDQDITMSENLVATPDPSTKGNREIVDQEVEGIGAIGNSVATPRPSVEGVSETMDQTVEDVKVNENLKVAPESGTEVFTETMDLDEVSDTESFVTAPGSVPEGINEMMDQEAEGTDAKENFIATPGPSVDEVSKEMYETAEDFKETEDLKSASASRTEAFTEIIDPDEVSVTESLVAVAESITEGINEITEDISVGGNIENIPLPNTESVSEINDKIAEGFGLTENLEATPRPSVEGVSETMDQTVEDVKVNENLKVAPESGTEVFTETMDLDEVSDTESFVTAPGSVPEGINEIMDQEAEGTDAKENFVATPGPSVDEVSKEMHETAEDFKETEDLKSASASRTEAFTEIMDPDEVSVTENLVAVAESITEGINEITEDISVGGNIENIPLPNTERVSEINDKIAEGFGLTENLEAIPVSSTGVSETHVQNENTTHIELDKEMSNTENASGSETSKTMESEAKSLKIVPGSKIKSRKRKIAHPPISEMLMDSIKSLKKSSGVSFEDIKTQMEKNYPVNVKALVKYHVINFLKKWVEMGILEKVDGADMEERFIIKESEISYENDCIIQAKKLKIN